MLVRFYAVLSFSAVLSRLAHTRSPFNSTVLVTFRAHMAIMLILTLTISAFDPEDNNTAFTVAGDYSAVFPLLVVSVFVSLMCSRDTVFYPTQRSRGDITAVPEVLCQPGLEGAPLVVVHEQSDDSYSNFSGSYDGSSYTGEDSQSSDIELAVPEKGPHPGQAGGFPEQALTQKSIEEAFAAANSAPKVQGKDVFAQASDAEVGRGTLTSSRLDELLKMPITNPGKPKNHRRTQSAPMWDNPKPKSSHTRKDSRDWGAVESAPPTPPSGVSRSRTNSSGSQKDLMRITSFGEIQHHQPSLMEQARMRAASSQSETIPQHRRVPSMPSNTTSSRRHKRVPSLPMGRSRQHSRTSSQNSQGGMANMLGSLNMGAVAGALSMDDIEQSFSAVVNEKVMEQSPWSNSKTS